MKRTVLYLIMVLMPFSFNSLYGETAGPSDTVRGYFEALKNGDIGTMKQHIAGEYYEKYKALLEKNESYPEFLRNFYEGAEYEIVNSNKMGNDVIMEVEIYFPNGSTSVNKLRVRNFNKDGWKIIKEIRN